MFRPKESKLAKDKNSAPLFFQSIEPGKTSRIDKRKEYLKKKWDRKNNILVIGDKANAIEDGKKKRNN